MFVSDLLQIDGFLRVLRFPLPRKLTAKYNSVSNIVESGVKYHKTKPIKITHLTV